MQRNDLAVFLKPNSSFQENLTGAIERLEEKCGAVTIPINTNEHDKQHSLTQSHFEASSLVQHSQININLPSKFYRYCGLFEKWKMKVDTISSADKSRLEFLKDIQNLENELDHRIERYDNYIFYTTILITAIVSLIITTKEAINKDGSAADANSKFNTGLNYCALLIPIVLTFVSAIFKRKRDNIIKMRGKAYDAEKTIRKWERP